MPPKRTPTKVKTPKAKTPGEKSKTRLITPAVHSRDSSAASTHSVPGSVPVLPVVVPPGLSPEFLAFMQMQERLRREERAEERAEAEKIRAVLENQRKDDLERAEAERFAQNKPNETQIKMLQEQLAAMAGMSGSGPKSSSKMPVFDLVKDKETFKLWKSRWEIHIQGHKFDKISDPEERNIKLRSELNSCLSDSTLNWLLNNTFSVEDLAKAEFVLNVIELKVNESANPLIQQVEMSRIAQYEHETGDSLCQRIREVSSKCAYDKITNVQDHFNMITLIIAVKPQVRKKMFLEKVDTFDKAVVVLLSEEQAHADTKQCSESTNADVFAASTYKKEQRSERQNFQPNGKSMPSPDFVCPRCSRVGLHNQGDCPANYYKCKACDKQGHYAVACKGKLWLNLATPAQANSVKAYLAKQSVNDICVFNAQQVEKAKSCGLTYNIEAGKCEEYETMTEYQKEFIATGSFR